MQKLYVSGTQATVNISINRNYDHCCSCARKQSAV